MTFFGKIEHRFLPIPDDKRILTQPFLQACNEGIVPFIDNLGTAFSPVKSDVVGNISKLQKKFDMDREKFSTLNSMLEEELETKSTDLAKIGALWLNRGLEFICHLLKTLVENKKSGQTEENLGVIVREAYEVTLKKYHGWFTQKLVSGVMTRALPSRKALVKGLGDEGATESQIIGDMSDFMEGLSKNTEVLAETLEKLGLDDPAKVK